MKLVILFVVFKLSLLEPSLAAGRCPKSSVFSKPRSSRKVTTTGNVQRIVGGWETPIEEAPYMAAVLRFDNLLCGASIVSPQFVVSAAHCFDKNRSPKGLTVRIGSSYYSKEGEVRNAQYVAVHYRFSRKTGEYDCAVIKTKDPFSKKTPYMELELSSNDPKIGDILTVSGWGFTKENGSVSPTLKSTEVMVLENIVCELAYWRLRWTVPATGFCAGDEIHNSDSCQGDSGGPAVKGTTLVGITSFGSGCGRPNSPGVYTNVAKVEKWIEGHIRPDANLIRFT